MFPIATASGRSRILRSWCLGILAARATILVTRDSGRT
jgi:hypothetical protein